MKIQPVKKTSIPQSMSLACKSCFISDSTGALYTPPFECQKLATCIAKSSVSVLAGTATVLVFQKGMASALVAAGLPF